MSSLREIGAVFNQFRNVVTEMEHDINKNMKSKFVLLDKCDSDAMVALSKVSGFKSRGGQLFWL